MIFIVFLENIRNFIIQNIKDYNLYNLNLIIQLNIQEKTEQKDNICCKYTLFDPNLSEIDLKENVYEDKNILVKQKFEKFKLFISDIIKVIYDLSIVQEKKENLPIFSNISTITLKSSDYFTNSTNGNEYQIKKNILNLE